MKLDKKNDTRLQIRVPAEMVEFLDEYALEIHSDRAKICRSLIRSLMEEVR